MTERYNGWDIRALKRRQSSAAESASTSKRQRACDETANVFTPVNKHPTSKGQPSKSVSVANQLRISKPCSILPKQIEQTPEHSNLIIQGRQPFGGSGQAVPEFANTCQVSQSNHVTSLDSVKQKGNATYSIYHTSMGKVGTKTINCDRNSTKHGSHASVDENEDVLGGIDDADLLNLDLQEKSSCQQNSLSTIPFSIQRALKTFDQSADSLISVTAGDDDLFNLPYSTSADKQSRKAPTNISSYLDLCTAHMTQVDDTESSSTVKADVGDEEQNNEVGEKNSDDQPPSAGNGRDISCKVQHLPITRPPFPNLARDRSPIIGLSSTSYLRTCFRIGDAINTGRRSVHLNQPVILEIYAHVQRSWRESNNVKQHFIFHDLFHNHAPFLEGVYDIWRGISVWERDCEMFLGSAGEGKIARMIGKMTRKDDQWRLTILSIWEAEWEDVDYVKGIICE